MVYCLPSYRTHCVLDNFIFCYNVKKSERTPLRFVNTLLFLFIFLYSALDAAEIQEQYVIEGRDFNASHIDPAVEQDFILYHFSEHKTKKAFDPRTLIDAFKDRGLSLSQEPPHIIHVTRTSKHDLSAIKAHIREYYLSHYPTMDISKVQLFAHAFPANATADYRLKFKNRAYLHASSSVQLLFEGSKQRVFIPYEITATLELIKASHNINRGTILKPIDISLSTHNFKRLKGELFHALLPGEQRVNKRLVAGRILYKDDVEQLPEVTKGTQVYAQMINGLVHLEFQAKALSDGRKGELIYVEKNDGQRIKTKVIGKNRVEVK